MKRKFFSPFFCLLILSILASCSKDEFAREKEAYMAFMLNGEYNDFSTHVSGNDPPLSDLIQFVVVSGKEKDDHHATSIGFDLLDEAGLTTGSYHTSDSDLYATYTIQLVEHGEWIGSHVYNTGESGTYFRVEIDKLDRWGVRGTFDGVLRSTDTGEIIRITEGRFAAPYNTYK